MALIDDYLGKPDSSIKVEEPKEDTRSLFDKYLSVEEDKPKKQQAFWQGFNDDPTWSGLAARVGIGALRGAKDVIDTGAEGLAKGTAYLAEKTLPESISKSIRESANKISSENKAEREEFEKEYPSSEGIMPTATDIGRVGGQIVGTLPIMPTKLIGGIEAAAGALPRVVGGITKTAPLSNRLLAAAGTGAVGGATLGASTSSINDKSLAENVGTGLLSGAVAGPALTGVTSAAKGLVGKTIGKVSERTAELAKRAEELGINLKATQVSDSHLLKKFDQMSGMLPFSGQQGITAKQQQQFTRAISRTFGRDINEISPEIAEDARKEIGKRIGDVFKNSTSKVDQNLATDLDTVYTNAKSTMTPGEVKAVKTQIANVLSKIDQNGNFTGEAFHGLTKFNAVLSKAQQSSNPNIANAANDIRTALESLLTRNMSANERMVLSQARKQYKAVMTVKDLVDQSAEGYVSPLKLMQKVNKAPGGKLRSGDLGELADIGRKFFPTPSDSGTPLGEKILTGIGALTHNPAGALGAGAAALYHGAFLQDLASGGVGLTANRLIRAGINSKAVRNALIRSGTGETHGVVNKLSGKVIPYASVPIINRDNKREPLRITVTKTRDELTP